MMREDIQEAFAALRRSLVESKSTIQRLSQFLLFDNDDKLSLQRTAKGFRFQSWLWMIFEANWQKPIPAKEPPP